MPRPWRVEFAGACYHVINRGNYRRHLFAGKGAALKQSTSVSNGWLAHRLGMGQSASASQCVRATCCKHQPRGDHRALSRVKA